MDDKTPEIYRDILGRIKYRNLKFVYINFRKVGIIDALLNDTRPGQYDLITTRLDNDDAIHQDTINDIQTAYLRGIDNPKPWAIDMPFGCTLDLATKKMYITEYPFNANITLIEDSQQAGTVWQCQHGQIQQKFNYQFIGPKPYWIIVLHSQNLGNNINSSPGRTIYTNKPVGLRVLGKYGIDVNELDAMSKLTLEQMQNRHKKINIH